MAQLTRQLRAQQSRANRTVGRRTGRTIARYPLPNSLTFELAGLFTAFDISHVVDVGAHHGGFVERLRQEVGYDSLVTSFEPSPEHFRHLVAAASGDPRWSVRNVGLGARAGTFEFHRYSGDGQFDSLRPLSAHATPYKSDLSLSGMIPFTV